MTNRSNRVRIIKLVTCITGLVIFVTMGAPWMEQMMISSEQKEILKQKELSPTDLFYMESEAALEVYHDRSH